MSPERLYIVTYDIADAKRWRKVFKLMNGYGDWLQFSVFQCRLTPMRYAELLARVDIVLNHSDDHVLLIDVGPAENLQPRIVSLGKGYAAIERRPVIV